MPAPEMAVLFVVRVLLLFLAVEIAALPINIELQRGVADYFLALPRVYHDRPPLLRLSLRRVFQPRLARSDKPCLPSLRADLRPPRRP